MFKIVIVDDDRQMQAIIRDKIKEKTDAFRDAKIQIFSSAEAFLAEAKQEDTGLDRRANRDRSVLLSDFVRQRS